MARAVETRANGARGETRERLTALSYVLSLGSSRLPSGPLAARSLQLTTTVYYTGKQRPFCSFRVPPARRCCQYNSVGERNAPRAQHTIRTAATYLRAHSSLSRSNGDAPRTLLPSHSYLSRCRSSQTRFPPKHLPLRIIFVHTFFSSLVTKRCLIESRFPMRTSNSTYIFSHFLNPRYVRLVHTIMFFFFEARVGPSKFFVFCITSSFVSTL